MPPHEENAKAVSTGKLIEDIHELDMPTWIMLIEARRSDIKDFLMTTTLAQLGTVKCLRTDDELVELGSHGTIRRTQGYNGFFTQGIFGKPFKSIDANNVGVLHIWGLTHNGDWILATVGLVEHQGSGLKPDTVPVSLHIEKTELTELLAMLRLDPFDVWITLEDAVGAAAIRAQELADITQSLTASLFGETSALLPKIKDAAV